MKEANLIIDHNFLTEEHKVFIDNYILDTNFPWYFLNGAVAEDDKNWFFFHTILTRPEGHSIYENRVNADHSDMFVDMLETFCENNNLECNKIFRISVNLVFPNGNLESLIHVDHNFPHKQLILYLNDSPTSMTNVYNENQTEIIHKITAEKFKGASFNALPHSVTLPTEGRRVVIVYTFE